MTSIEAHVIRHVSSFHKLTHSFTVVRVNRTRTVQTEKVKQTVNRFNSIRVFMVQTFFLYIVH